jgi:outer membrane protein TolC
MKREKNKCCSWVKRSFILVLLLLPAYLPAQKTILTPDAYIEQVRQYHPVAKQANLIIESAAASLLAAKGGFDPVASYELDDKTLDGTRYYRYNNAGIKIPTPIGIDVKAGFENSSGTYKNPELTTGVASYLGVEIPLLNGLLMDKKRAALKQAKIYESQSEQEKVAMINDLLYDAYSTYWEWTGSYRLYRIFRNYAEVSSRRLELVKTSFRNGGLAMADTIEAHAQWQSFILAEKEALLELNNKTLDLSQFLWSENGDPYFLPGDYIPDTASFDQLIPIPELESMSATLQETHPELRGYRYKIESLEVEQKLKFQNLLPSFNLQANALSKDYFAYQNFGTGYLENNYKLGVSLRMPLLLRQGRGDYRNAQIKIKQADLSRNEKSLQLQNKLKQYYNEALTRQDQLNTTQSMYRNYAALLRNEELKFSQGESSLFLINSRENKVLEMQQKLVNLRIKYLKAVYAIEWARGILR